MSHAKLQAEANEPRNGYPGRCNRRVDHEQGNFEELHTALREVQPEMHCPAGVMLVTSNNDP